MVAPRVRRTWWCARRSEWPRQRRECFSQTVVPFLVLQATLGAPWSPAPSCPKQPLEPQDLMPTDQRSPLPLSEAGQETFQSPRPLGRMGC